MQRRNFLKTSASAAFLAGTLPACAVPSTQEEKAYTHQGRINNYQKFSVIDPGLKITGIETWSRPDVAVVRVTADNGMEGWGQISTYDADISATVLHRKIASLVLGSDPADIDDLADRCVEADIEGFVQFDAERRNLLIKVDDLKHFRNKVSDEIGKMRKSGQDASLKIDEMKKSYEENQDILQ